MLLCKTGVLQRVRIARNAEAERCTIERFRLSVCPSRSGIVYR